MQRDAFSAGGAVQLGAKIDIMDDGSNGSPAYDSDGYIIIQRKMQRKMQRKRKRKDGVMIEAPALFRHQTIPISNSGPTRTR